MQELARLKPRRTIYGLIDRIRKKSGYKLTREDAAYNLAGTLGIDIAKYLPSEELERLKRIPAEVKVIETRSKQGSKPLDLKIQGVPTNIPYLKTKIIKDCERMSKTYQLFYLLENSVRSFILSVLQSEYPSEDWWNKDSIVRQKIRKEVEIRMKQEKENRWHATRGDHYIHYTNFSNLKEIIIDNWTVFKRFFPDQAWIISRLKDLELSRNIIAHNNPLPQDEVRRIKLYFRDWTKQIKKEER